MENSGEFLTSTFICQEEIGGHISTEIFFAITCAIKQLYRCSL